MLYIYIYICVCVCVCVSIYLCSLAGHKNPSYMCVCVSLSVYVAQLDIRTHRIQFVLFHLFCSDLSICTQIIKSYGEEITAMHGVGCFAKGVYNLHRLPEKHANQMADNLSHQTPNQSKSRCMTHRKTPYIDSSNARLTLFKHSTQTLRTPYTQEDVVVMWHGQKFKQQ